MHTIITVIEAATESPSMISISMQSHNAIIIAVITSVSSITLCASSSMLFIVVSVVCLKLKLSNQRADSASTIECDGSNPEAHMYEAIAPVPKTLINLEESMDKNIAYGPVQFTHAQFPRKI